MDLVNPGVIADAGILFRRVPRDFVNAKTVAERGSQRATTRNLRAKTCVFTANPRGWKEVNGIGMIGEMLSFAKTTHFTPLTAIVITANARGALKEITFLLTGATQECTPCK